MADGRPCPHHAARPTQRLPPAPPRLPALAAARRHAHLHEPAQPRRDARRHQEASTSMYNIKPWHHTYSFTDDEAAGHYMHGRARPSKLLRPGLGLHVRSGRITHGGRSSSRVTIHSTMYWAVKGRSGANKVMSFHLDPRQMIPSLVPLPSSRPNLAEVSGRLGIVFSCLCQPMKV
jgi:hypothetical protein